MNIRDAAYQSYTRLYAVDRELRDIGMTIAPVLDSLKELSSFLCCPGCNRLVDRCDSTIYVHACGHCFHKRNCWTPGSKCSLCTPNRG